MTNQPIDIPTLLRVEFENLALEASEVKEARESFGLSEAEFALLLGVASPRTIRRWEDGEKDVPTAAIKLIELLLDCKEAREYMQVGEFLPEGGYLSLFQ